MLRKTEQGVCESTHTKFRSTQYLYLFLHFGNGLRVCLRAARMCFFMASGIMPAPVVSGIVPFIGIRRFLS
jgi:hypothetical protein